MRKLITLLLALTLTLHGEDYKNPEKFIEKKARITYYWPGNGGQVGTITATGKRAMCGKSAAVDPKIIPYGSEIHIPRMGKVLMAVDTGSAVKNRTASRRLGKDYIVIDVFCRSRAEAMRRIKQYPMFMMIYIKKEDKN
jgi:3D (Asp-Asp-Asp) domain-containing protein